MSAAVLRLACSIGVLASVLPACVVDGSLGDNQEASLGVAEAAVPDTGEHAADAGELSSGSGGSGGAAGSTGSDTAEGQAGATALGHGCEASIDDSACLACRKQQCCDTLVTCQDDTLCLCLTDCTDAPESVAACETHCGQSINAPTTDLHTCSTEHCAEECELSPAL